MTSPFLTIWYLTRAITSHPLASPVTSTVRRMLAWQLASRISGHGHVVPFVDQTRLIVTKGMAGATGNIYFGLHEYESMAFILHLLQSGDVFLDVGANVGSYTVLASGVRRATTLAFEPVPSTYGHLVDNVQLNGISQLVQTHLSAVADYVGVAKVTSTLDSMNHIASADDSGPTIDTPVVTLDQAARDLPPVTAMKLDVEGYELSVLRGASQCLESPNLLAIIAETNDLSGRYGASTNAVTSLLSEHGFGPFAYDPRTRVLEPLSAARTGGNTLYLRKLDDVRARVMAARPFEVLGTRF